MLTGAKLARLKELAEQRRSGEQGEQGEKVAKLAAEFQRMSKLRQADLAALKGDDALTRYVRALSGRTIRKMYLAQPNPKGPVES